MGRFSRALSHIFNVFSTDENTITPTNLGNIGASYGAVARPHTVKVRVSNERSIISSIYTRLAVDVANNTLRHVKVDDQGQYKETVNSSFNDCLTVEANLDQGPRAFLHDYAMTLFDKGVACVVPVDTTVDPRMSGSWDVNSMRVGQIVAWYPRQVRVRLYNDAPDKGMQEEITLPKSQVAIVENPFFAIMNEPNSTLQRLIHKLNLLDTVDEVSASGKLDMIIQLPYQIKSQARRDMADQRRKDIEFQLRGSEYGIAYTDGTEKITQLNRPATNNLMEQVTYLQTVLYEQLGITAEVLNGSADEKTMLNYRSRILVPVLDALKEEFIRKFLTKTARTQGQTIQYFQNPFELMPLSELAEVADVLSRNEIVTPNELRTSIGMMPHPDASANKLQNSNMPDGSTPGNQAPAAPADPTQNGDPASGDADANAALDQVDKAISDAFSDFSVPDDNADEESPDAKAS